MAKQKKPRRQHAVLKKEGGQELIGIGLILMGLLIFCSLIRFTTVDFIDWKFFGSFAPEGVESRNTQNLIGPVGALIGFVFIALFGAAAYLLAVGTIWLGFVVAWFKSRLGLNTLIGFGSLMFASAALFSVLEIFGGVHFGNWPGGAVGEGLGNFVFKSLLGSVGATIVLFGVYLASVILLTGWHPVTFARASLVSIGAFISSSRAKRAARPAPPAPVQKRAKRKKGQSVAEPTLGPESSVEEDGQGVLQLRQIPTPQIIDSSQKKVAPLAGARPFERKKPTHTGLSTEGFEDYELPGFDLLEFDEENDVEPEDFSEELLATQTMIIETCRAFGVEVTAGDITRGPTITRYEIYPAIGLRVSRITQLEADLARATKAERINILAPIPGKDTVGIEIANDDRVAVALRELLQDESFRSSKRKIPLALGKDVYGNTVVGDLAAMPHCLVAGATGAGKSVCINSIITSILYKFGPDELRFIMIDPKVVEMQVYAKLPHLVVPVVTDPKRVVGALNWCVNEMERRYKIFAKLGVRNFDSFNNRVRTDEEVVTPEEQEDLDSIVDEEAVESMAKAFEDGDLGPVASQDDEVDEDDLEVPDRFPYIVVIIDELADLMQTAPADVEGAIARIAQKARAAGIHLIVATQTPRADVVTGIIKANIPSRIAFQVSSSLDSRVILDNKGAEKLVGKGDMLFLPPGSAKLERAQGAFVSDEEVEQIVNFCANQTEQRFEESIQKVIESGGSDGDGGGEEVSDADEETLERCMEVLRAEGKASTSLLQRRLRLGYTRAARMIDILEARGIVGPADGAKPREVLIPVTGDE
ncbi:MAG: DNA translocase FtsK [Verrucomicrobiaceae bacterium]|nr:MAG: DNA translocase FtsK [Verrucomicrobiaceae bacterium]